MLPLLMVLNDHGLDRTSGMGECQRIFPRSHRPDRPFGSQTFFPYQAITVIINTESAAPVQERMAHPAAKIKYLEHELDQQEKLITMMETSLSAATEDRIAALEKKVREMEALVKGLTQELLDLKSVSMKMNKASEERSRQEMMRGPVIQATPSSPAASAAIPSASGSTVIRPKGAARQAEAPAAPPEPAMEMIMQTDGTMKAEPRRGDRDYIVASAGYGKKKGAAAKGKQSDLIYATEETKSDPAKK